MTRNNGKLQFYQAMLNEELITKDEFDLLLWYDRKVKEQLEKEVD